MGIPCFSHINRKVRIKNSALSSFYIDVTLHSHIKIVSSDIAQSSNNYLFNNLKLHLFQASTTLSRKKKQTCQISSYSRATFIALSGLKIIISAITAILCSTQNWDGRLYHLIKKWNCETTAEIFSGASLGILSQFD